MFEKRIIPKLTPGSKYPVNIHSCAEAILCQATLLGEFPERKQDLEKTFEWIIRNMEYAAGQYTYLIKKPPLIGEWRLNIPMMRWGQAWMMRALSELYVAV